MPLYRWPNGAIANMEVTKSADGQLQAMLRASSAAGAFTELMQMVESKHLASYISDDEPDKLMIPALQEKDSQAIINLLTQVQGKPQIINVPEENQSKKKAAKKSPVGLSAIFFLLSDASWIVSGIQRGRHNRSGKFTSSDISELMIGVVEGLGDVLLLTYGGHKNRPPLVAFSEAFTENLEKRGVQLPKAEATPEEIHKSGFFAAANNFLRKNVISIKSAMKVASGVLLMKAAAKKDARNPAKFAGGMLLTSGWLTTFALDKPHVPPFQLKEKTTGTPSTIQSIFHEASAHPRAISGFANMGQDVLKVGGALDEARKFHKAITNASNPQERAWAERKQYDFAWNIISSCSAAIGSYFFSKSGSKADPYKDNPEGLERDLLMAAANVLSHVPEDARNYSIEETAAYMASIKGIYANKEELAKAITDKITTLQQSPFHIATPSAER